MAGRYGCLSRAQLSVDYLHTNSTTHEFLFGALAELVDNSRDAQSTKLNIYTVKDDSLRGGRILCFLDDGEGMDPGEAADIIRFGNSSKRAVDSNLIGQYGNGLKSGSMRIGKDLILFTKRHSTMTCLFMSRTFHEKERLKEVVVPLPSWDAKTRCQLARTSSEEERRQVEIDIILTHSPFPTEKDLLDQFSAIDTPTGTLVMVYNLRLLDSGQPELDFTSDPMDIRLTDDGDDLERAPLEKKSFRAYTSILYFNPRMKVNIQGCRVASRRLQQCLYKSRLYHFTSKRFKTRSEQDATQAEEQAKLAEEKARELEETAQYELAQVKVSSTSSKEARATVRQAQTVASNARAEADLLQKIVLSKQKALKHPKTLTFTFGFNLSNRGQDGMFIYNCSRLIKMYERTTAQQDGGGHCRGIVGIVDIPYVVLEPTHNKQDFADAKEYRHLLKAMNDHLLQFWKDSGIEFQGVDKFWESFGYRSETRWDLPPSDEPKFVRKRAMQLLPEVQCEKCLKWRTLPFSVKNIGKEFSPYWTCSMNTDLAHNNCAASEQKLNIPVGTLQKSTKTDAEKKADLVEQMEKQQKKLEELEKRNRTLMPELLAMRSPVRTAASSREALAAVVSSKQKGSAESQAAASLMTVKQLAKRKTSSPWKSRVVVGKEDQEGKDGEKDLTVSPPIKKVRKEAESSNERTAPVRRKRGRPRKLRPSMTDSDRDEKESEESVNGDVTSRSAGPYTIGSRVDALKGRMWLAGRVTNIDPDRVCVKFDLDERDQWYELDSSKVRLQKHIPDSPSVETPSTTTGFPEQKQYVEGSMEYSSHGTFVSSGTSSSHADKIAKLLRECLQYFLPPDWVMKKEEIDGLSLAELADFPLDGFVKHYEQGVTKLISGFQAQAEAAKRRAREKEEKLYMLRKSVSQLLRSIGNDYPLGADDHSENVDDLLQVVISRGMAKTK